MAEIIADASGKEGAEVRLKEVADASNDDLVWADGIVIGSPVYFGLPSGEIKKFIDDSISVRRQLENKVGAAFVSSGHRAGGRETAIMALLGRLSFMAWSCAATRCPLEGIMGPWQAAAPMTDVLRSASGWREKWSCSRRNCSADSVCP